MKRILKAIVIAGGLTASSADAGPQNNQHFLFATVEECTQYLWALYRGNHAYFCEWTPVGWYITEDYDYKNLRKTPNK